jgi:hypothetical protein
MTTTDGHKLMIVDMATRKATSTVELKEIQAEISFSTRLAWLDGTMLASGGLTRCRYETIADCPALIVMDVEKGAGVWKTWPEWSGRKINDVTMTPDGDSLLICVVGPLPLEKEDRIELYRWTPETDTTTRLTSSGDIQSVSNTGR